MLQTYDWTLVFRNEGHLDMTTLGESYKDTKLSNADLDGQIFYPCAYAGYLRSDSQRKNVEGWLLRAEEEGSIELVFNGDSFRTERWQGSAKGLRWPL